MSPFDDYDDGDVEDAEFVEYAQQPAPQQVYAPPQTVSQPDFKVRDVVRLDPVPQDQYFDPTQLAIYDKRARAVTLFIKVPLLAFVAFNDKTPGLIRLGAGLLALWEASQLARSAGEVEQTVTQWAQP